MTNTFSFTFVVWWIFGCSNDCAMPHPICLKALLRRVYSKNCLMSTLRLILQSKISCYNPSYFTISVLASGTVWRLEVQAYSVRSPGSGYPRVDNIPRHCHGEEQLFSPGPTAGWRWKWHTLWVLKEANDVSGKLSGPTIFCALCLQLSLMLGMPIGYDNGSWDCLYDNVD